MADKMASAVFTIKKERGILKKILLVLTGGTICTAVNQKGVRAIHGKAASLLQQGFLESDSVYRNEVEFHTTENFGILSENMTPHKWNQLLSYFRSVNFGEGYNGIVIAHGTDTLAYSASILSLLFAGKNIPVFLVSSAFPLENEKANGHIHFRTAVEWICKELPAGVYVPYRNENGKLFLHLASRLEQCKNYSNDFYSVGAMDITKGFTPKAKKQAKGVISTPCLDPMGDWQFEKGVLAITPYVGLNYQTLSLEGVNYILHGTYHSGTVCTQMEREGEEYNEYSVLTLLDRCRKNNVPVFFAPAQNSGEVYESVPLMANHGGEWVDFVYGCTYEMAYAKLLVACSLGMDNEQTKAFMQTDVCGEFFIKGEES